MVPPEHHCGSSQASSDAKVGLVTRRDLTFAWRALGSRRELK
jgi:hypothetical protein